jgi:hypothetical protein
MKRGNWLKLTLFLFGCVAFGVEAGAQTPPDHCWVKYSYDAAGNRIKREWWCGDPGGADENATPRSQAVNSIGVRAYPNPATESFEVVTDAEIQSGEAILRDEHSRVVLSQRLHGTRTLFDISGIANGIYVLEVRVGDVEYSTRITISH